MLKKILIGTTVALFLLTIYFIFNWRLLSSLKSLKDVTLKNISIDKKTYSLVNGEVYEGGSKLHWFIPGQREKVAKVAALVGFYEWNKEDPLLSGPDFSASEFNLLTQLLTNLSRDFQADMKLKDDMFPLKFLQSVPKVKNSADEFAKNPSRRAAERLLTVQHQTINYYKQDVQKRLKLMKTQMTEKNKNTNLLYVGVATTPSIIVSDYEMVLENANEIENELKLREQCLSGKGLCQGPSDSFSTLKTVANSSTKLNILGEDILQNRYPNPDMVRTGPFSVITPCLGLNNDLQAPKQAYFLYEGLPITYPPIAGNKSIITQYATQAFFRRVTGRTIFDRFYQSLGLTWVPEPATQTYDCPDLSYLAKLATMNSYIPKIGKNPLFKNAPLTGKNETDEIITDGRSLEEKLLTAKIKDYDDFENLENLYLKYYSLKKDDKFLSYGLGMQRLLADFTSLFAKTIAEFITVSILQRMDNIDSSMIYLYGIRNIPSFTYLTFSPSFWRIDQKPTYYQKKQVNNIGFNSPYLTYDLAITKYSKDEIASWYKNVILDVYDYYEHTFKGN